MQEPLRMHEFFVFDRAGRLLHHQSFSRSGLGGAEESKPQERGKLVYGVLFSLKQMIPSLSPADQIVEEGIRSLTTGAFTLHSFESPTGYRFATVSSVASQQQQAEVRAALERVFSDLFVELVMLDPTYKPGTAIESPVFAKAVAAVLQSLGTS